ncbi:hypothetical protein Bca4012_064184 [Brassica carinata]
MMSVNGSGTVSLITNRNAFLGKGLQHCAIFLKSSVSAPRLCAFRSDKHLCVQVIDDTKLHTLASASIKQKSISEYIDYTSEPTINFWIESKRITNRINLMDKMPKPSGYPYHGRIQAITAAARERDLYF